MTNNTNTYQPSLVSQISHEIRNPLTGILGMARFLEKTRLTHEQKKYLQVILFSANQLLGLEDKLATIFESTKNESVTG